MVIKYIKYIYILISLISINLKRDFNHFLFFLDSILFLKKFREYKGVKYVVGKTLHKDGNLEREYK